MLLLALACAAPDGAPDPAVAPWTAPDTPGPYGVSATTLRWTDARGQDLVAEVWYPVDACDDPEPYEEIPITGESCRDLAPSSLGAPFPLVAFSHGFGGYVNLDLAHARISTLGVAWFGLLLAGDERYAPYLAAQDIVSWTEEP